MLTARDIASVIQAAKELGKPVKRSDGGGMFLYAKPDGSASWHISFRLNGKQNTNSLGQYPIVSLKEARERRGEAKRKIEQGINPANERRTMREAARVANANTFKSVADDWLERQGGTEGTKRRRRNRIEQFLYPDLGSRPIGEITAGELRDVLRKIERAGKLHTLKRVLRLCSGIWHYAMVEGKAANDIPSSLKERNTFKTVPIQHQPAITDPKKFGGLLRSIDKYSSPLTRAAMKLLVMIFVRPIELRKMEWTEIDFESSTWTIPADKTKMRREQLVPLSQQAVKILRNIEETRDRETPFVFYSTQTEDRPMSENTLNKALRTMGYPREVHVSHGFRSSASTLLREQGLAESAVIELQLAHKVPGVEGAYNRAERLKERREMMQKWSDYLDTLKAATE